MQLGWPISQVKNEKTADTEGGEGGRDLGRARKAEARVGQMDRICYQNRWRSWLVLILEFIKSPGAFCVFKQIKLCDWCRCSAAALRRIFRGLLLCGSMQPAAKSPPPLHSPASSSSKQVHFFVWSQYFPPRQWRLLFRPWLLSKLTWLNWLRANELLDWSCQAPQEVMLLHLWGATPATAAICCLGLSQGFKKKKSKLQKVPQALCVFWSAVSDDTLRWTRTCKGNSRARQTDIHIYTL